jgi:hypothetical protein
MKDQDFVEGITILMQHYKDKNGYHLGAEQDIFYMYSTDTPLSEDEFNKMTELGWFQENVDGEEDGESNKKYLNYDPCEGWAAFT